jgi:enoyl-CoA hydratase
MAVREVVSTHDEDGMQQSLTTLLFETSSGIAQITVNRPARLNALNSVAKDELRRIMISISNDPSVRVVVITGAGEKAFVAGTDIEELTSLDQEEGRRFSSDGQAIMDLLESSVRPVIAAVNGYALGGGCELAMACHLRLASDRATFGMPEVNLGIIPGYGGTQRLARIVGKDKALELMLTGVRIDAQEALRIGLVHRVVPAAGLMTSAMDLARGLAEKAPRAIEALLTAVHKGRSASDADGMRLESEEFGKCCATEDFREGVRAFLEKRPPRYRGE